MFQYLLIILVTIPYCFCYAEYDIFQGFDAKNKTSTVPPQDTTIITTTSNSTTYETYTSSVATPSEEAVIDDISNYTETFEFVPIKIPNNFLENCPEEELPLNIGAYEVPTQRDLVLFTKNTLIRMFNSYHEKALYLLDDIKQATRATAAIEKKCKGANRTKFRKCVIHVNKIYAMNVKNTVIALEKRKHDVNALTNGTICSLAALKTDPLQLVKILAMEETTIDFTLAGFLRLLGACSNLCTSKPYIYHKRRNLLVRHMTDQDLVVRHILTRKNYMQLINDSKTYV